MGLDGKNACGKRPSITTLLGRRTIAKDHAIYIISVRQKGRIIWDTSTFCPGNLTYLIMGVRCRHRDGYAFDTQKSRCGSRVPGKQSQQGGEPRQAFFAAELSLALLDFVDS